MSIKSVNYLTREWYEKLARELKELKEIKMPEVLKRLWDARAQWDLSENFDYKSSLEDRELINSRIVEIEELLDNVEIIKWKSKKSFWVVDFGSKVKIEMEDWKTYDLTIVWTWEVSLDDWFNISLESPMWKAIRWKKIWDTVIMKLLSSRQNVKILEIN